MLQMWEARTVCTRMWELAKTWSDVVPTYEEGEAELRAYKSSNPAGKLRRLVQYR